MENYRCPTVEALGEQIEDIGIADGCLVINAAVAAELVPEDGAEGDARFSTMQLIVDLVRRALTQTEES